MPSFTTMGLCGGKVGQRRNIVISDYGISLIALAQVKRGSVLRYWKTNNCAIADNIFIPGLALLVITSYSKVTL